MERGKGDDWRNAGESEGQLTIGGMLERVKDS